MSLSASVPRSWSAALLLAASLPAHACTDGQDVTTKLHVSNIQLGCPCGSGANHYCSGEVHLYFDPAPKDFVVRVRLSASSIVARRRPMALATSWFAIEAPTWACPFVGPAQVDVRNVTTGAYLGLDKYNWKTANCGQQVLDRQLPLRVGSPRDAKRGARKDDGGGMRKDTPVTR